MHLLDLETLSEERLINSIDSETYQMGKDLYDKGQTRLLELLDQTAHCTVQDIRNYHVHFKIEKQHLFLKCSCSHASRGLICEHDVAAWLEIREKLIERIPPEWQIQMEKLVHTRSNNSTNYHSQPFYLFFSIQKDPATGSLSWRIVPLILPQNALPKEVAGADLVNSAWDEILAEHPELLPRIRPLYQPIHAEACLNGGREAVGLANLIHERRRILGLSERFPIEDFMPLIGKSGAAIASGDSENPIQRALTVHSGLAELRLNLARSEAGLEICPILAIKERIIQIQADDFQIISEAPKWILTGSDLIELEAHSNLEIIDSFRSAPVLTIPASQEAAFTENYFLDLAREIPLQGEAIHWETVSPNPIPRLYLSETSGELLIQLRFAYDQMEVDYDSNLPRETLRNAPGKLTLIKLQRETEREQWYYDLLISNSYGLKRAPLPAQTGILRLRARTHPVDFLIHTMPRLVQEGFEIFGEEKLKSARVNRNTPTISFRVSTGIDWFDVQTVVNFGELEVPLKEIRRLVRKQERFVKLSDGSIGEIPEDWLERYRHLFAIGELQQHDLRFSKRHITIIEQALLGADQIEIDEEFAIRRKKLQALFNEEFRGIKQHELTEHFIGELRPYQKAGYDWLHFLKEYEFGGCLADDMGLGKTIQTLAFLQSIYDQSRALHARPAASLLVVPRSLLINWQREAARFTPQLNIFEYFESDRERDPGIFGGRDLVITTYGVMLRDIQFLHGYEFHYAILDESQSIKNPLSQTARAAHLLQADHRLVLTGTPIENSTSELWSQFNFLNPGLLGNLKYFKNEFGLPIEKKRDHLAAEKLRKIVYPFILRRTKAQVAPELPPRTERILFCDMEPAQRKLYNRTRDTYRGMLMGLLETRDINESRMKILEGLLRLRQISIHPRMYDEKFHGASGKFNFLLETLETLRMEGHKALVFSQFVQMLSLVRQEIDLREIPYTYLDGQTQNRQEQVDLFQNDPSIPFFLISLKAGGLGLNLTAADYVIHIDPWWNPAVEMQASDRTHRIGQDKPVFVFKLITRDSVEEKILLLQERKRQLVDQIIANEAAYFKDLTIDDVKVLFS